MRRAASSFVVGIFALLFSLAFYSPIRADDTTFTITSYVPSHFNQWRWWLIGNGDVSSSNSSARDSAVLPSRLSSRRDVRGRLTSSVLRTYYTPDRFGNMLFTFSPGSDFSSDRYSQLENSLEMDLRWDSTYQSAWTHGINAYLQASHSVYVARDVYVSLSGDVDARWSEMPPFTQDRFDSLTVQYLNGYHRSWSNSRTEQSSVRHDYSISFRPAVGVGRVYEGGYAATAIDMIEALRDGDLLAREPGYGEMVALADSISRYRRTAPMDSRDHRIASLTAIAGFLESAGILTGNAYRAALLLEDVWRYYPHGYDVLADDGSQFSVPKYSSAMARPFGWRVEAGVRLGWQRTSGSNSRYEYGYEHGFTVTVDSLGGRDSIEYDVQANDTHCNYNYSRTNRCVAVAGFQWYQPLSYRWQFDFDHEIEIALHDKYRSENSEREATASHLDYLRTQARWYDDSYLFLATANLTYYFDKRNTIRATLQPRFSHYAYTDSTVRDYGSGPEIDVSHYCYDRYQVSASCTYQWRFSEPTTVLARVTASWDRTERPHDKWSSSRTLSFGIQVRHYIL